MNEETLEVSHPLRRLFRNALDFGLQHTPTDRQEVADYLEDQVLCEFLHRDNLYKIIDPAGRCLEDIADMFDESSVLIHAQSFQREFLVHKHIGDYTLFMLGMFPKSLCRRRGREFTLGDIVVPDGSLSDHYILQGQRSYRIASEFTNGDIFLELSANFLLYKNLLEMVRIYLEETSFSQ